MVSNIVTGISSSSQLEIKMHLKGKVIKTNKAGAIIDIGVEKPALLHVSQIIVENKQPILRVEEFLKIGQEIEVYVRNIRDDRIEVTMKEPLLLEWREIKKDMVVKGKVTELEKFGAFVDIGAERPGLIHVSELTHGFVRNASEIVSVGDEIEAKIIDFNRRRKQIKLSMKAMQPGLDEIEGVKITPARPNRRNKRGKSNKEKTRANNEAPEEKEPTVMEIALREAMDKTAADLPTTKPRPKKLKNISGEQSEILSRTLKQRS
ncbi:MAG: S1 RNA-binding domain-containing protein [Anaerolineaceae bacterium]|nr:S1 RNA-binding domain-containing protein [Anaerolineaceae bacterium]